MSCQVFTDENGKTKVLANNGNESILYKQAVKLNTEESAITIWSVTQTDIFKEEVQPKNLDKNSEPNLKTVLSYITAKNITEPLTAQETFEVKQSLIGTEYNDAHELATKLKEALLAPTKQTLKSLNLYNNSEINDILKDPVLKNNILETAQKILNTNTEITQSIEINKDYLRVNPNERNALGKYKMNNPNVLEAEVIQQFGGIKDENEFEQKLAESDYQAPKKPDNSQNKATTKLVAEYFKAKLGQAVKILSENEMLAELKKRGFDSLQSLIIGEKGIQNTNDSNVVLNLAIAKSMREKSYPADTIRVATGWQYSERENKWKTEVEDGTFKSITPILNAKNVNFENDVHNGFLTDIYSNEELFKAYPELRETSIVVYETDGSLDDNEMFFYAKNNTIYINGKSNRFDFSKSENTSKSTILHEIQHAIQSFEGFAKGGSSEGLSEKIRETLTEIRASYSGGTIGTTTRDNFSEYLQKAITDKFGKEKADVILQSDIISSSYIEELFSDEFYLKLAGEVEARNVQSRMGQPRNQNLFTETEEVAEEQKIYLDQNNAQFSAKPLGTEDKVYGFYDQLSKEIFLNESLMSSNVLIHEMWHSTKGGVKIAAQKEDKTAKILLNEMNRIVEQSGMFNEQEVREDYRQGNKNGVVVDPMIIGEQGASRLFNAVTVLENLQLAKEMQSQEKDAKTIKLATGWEYNSTEKKWKTETEDIEFKNEQIKLNTEYTISDILKENEFTKAYPNLKNIKIIFNNESENTYNPTEGLIKLDAFGSINKVVQQGENTTNLSKVDGERLYKLFGMVRRNLIHELSHAIQREEGFSRGGTKYTISERAKELASLNDEDTGDVSKSKIRDAIYKTTNQSDLNILNLTLNYFEGNDRAFQIGYENLAGEVEATNASKRSNYTLNRRLQMLLFETEGIAEKDKIYLKQSLESYNISTSQAYAPRRGESEDEYVDRMKEEIEANLLGENSAKYFDKIAKENNLTDKEKKSFIDRVKAFIKSFSDWLAKQIGFEGLTPEQASKLTTKDILDRVTTTILQGQYRNSLFEDLSQFNKIKVVDENMQPKTNDEVSQTIRATLSDDESGVVRATLSDLEGLSSNVWNSNANAVKTLLRNTQEKAIEIGLDLKGLEQSYDTKTQAEILELIRSLDFVLNNSSEQSLDNFVEVYEDFFDVDKSEQVVTEKVDEKFRNRPLVKLETKDSDYKVFQKFGLVNIGNSVYLKTDALKKSLSEVDALMEANKMTLDESEIQDKVFSEDVSDADYDLDTLKKLINYRKYFAAENIKKETVEVRVPQQIENVEYLKSDFIGDIRKLQLENLDNKVLQNLQFGEKGITIKSTDLISIQELNNYLEENQDLKNYFKLNRNTNFQIEQNDDIVSERDLIVNGKILPQFKDNFRKINSETVQANTNEGFIRIGKDNYEKITNDLFSKLPVNETNFYVTEVEQPTLNINLSDYTSQKSSPKVEIKNKYSQKESEQIDDDIDCSKVKISDI